MSLQYTIAPASVRCPQCSNIIISETALPNKVKFYFEILYLRKPAFSLFIDSVSGHFLKLFYLLTILAHLSRRLIGELIVYPCSGVRCPSALTISNIFSKTACRIKAKFYVEPPWVGGTKVCSRHLGHMTKMATKPRPYIVKTLQKSSPEPAVTWYVASGTPAHHSLFK